MRINSGYYFLRVLNKTVKDFNNNNNNNNNNNDINNND